MDNEVQTTTNQNGVIGLEKYSELKQVILGKIAQIEDIEQVEKLSQIFFDIDKNVKNVKTNSLSKIEKIKHSVQARKIDLAKQSLLLLAGLGLTVAGICLFLFNDPHFGVFLTGVGLSNLGSPSNLIKLFLTTFNKNKE